MAEKLQFFPLDVTYRVVNNKAVIYLYGRTADGSQVCVIDENFEPYFYAVPKKMQPALEKLEKFEFRKDGEAYAVKKTEVVEKKYLGKDTEAIKVYTRLPRDIPEIREHIKAWEEIESTYEYDIHFSRRYLIDKGIIRSEE